MRRMFPKGRFVPASPIKTSFGPHPSSGPSSSSVTNSCGGMGVWLLVIVLLSRMCALVVWLCVVVVRFFLFLLFCFLCGETENNEFAFVVSMLVFVETPRVRCVWKLRALMRAPLVEFCVWH